MRALAKTLPRRLLALFTALAVVCFALTAAAAFTPPPHTGLVTDVAGALREPQRLAIHEKLDAYRRGAGKTVAVLLVASLDGTSIDDAAYETFRSWGIGQKGGDTGVLLVIATGEHKIRIETGKGEGGALTDLQTNDIIRQRIAPHMREGRVGDAIVDGTDAIMAALGGTPATTTTGPRRGGPAAAPRPMTCTGVLGFVVVILLVVVVLSFLVRRGGFFFFLPFLGGGGFGGRGGGGGGGGRNDDGGFGGGESGGGGSSGDY